MRRASSRHPVSRSAKPLGAISLDTKSGLRRPVRDRWEYVLDISPIPEQHSSSSVGDTPMLIASAIVGSGIGFDIPPGEPGSKLILGPVRGEISLLLG